jgi:hypothetical protein
MMVFKQSMTKKTNVMYLRIYCSEGIPSFLEPRLHRTLGLSLLDLEQF